MSRIFKSTILSFSALFVVSLLLGPAVPAFAKGKRAAKKRCRGLGENKNNKHCLDIKKNNSGKKEMQEGCSPSM